MTAELGTPIPADDEHAISVTLGTWQANVGYEEGEEWVVSRMKMGYPRFFVHPIIKKLEEYALKHYGSGIGFGRCMLFPSEKTARKCLAFLLANCSDKTTKIDTIGRVVELDTGKISTNSIEKGMKHASIYAVFYPESLQSLAKSFWQHSGEGISSRRAQYILQCIAQGGASHAIGSESGAHHPPGPKRYQRSSVAPREGAKVVDSKIAVDQTGEPSDKFIQERFGRYLNENTGETAKNALRRRIAGLLGEQESEQVKHDGRVEAEDVYLFPGGMSSIFNVHQLLLSLFGDNKKSVCFGFPYIDTLKILQKFGPGCHFFGNGEAGDLDAVEQILEGGEKIHALFCEFPSNPLLKSPDVVRIQQLADKYDFVVVIDETIGNFLNLNLLPYADILVSSLTKLFSGDGNVMGGSMVLNPQGRHIQKLRQGLVDLYEDNYWIGDAIVLERNSRDFVSRNRRINDNALLLCDLFLKNSDKVKTIHYPKLAPSRPHYDLHKVSDGGYGGLLSVVFFSQDQAIQFYDALNAEKGPSLGTNFTLASPYTLLAHYNELEWASQYGVDSHLVRISVGLEDASVLLANFEAAMQAITT